MTLRVDRIAVQVEGVQSELVGPMARQTIAFEYAPLTDDPLVALALQVNRDRLVAAMQNQDMPALPFF